MAQIDFANELYSYFGQVKDFTLGMKIAERFYEMGRQDALEESRPGADLEKALENEWKAYIDRGAAIVDSLEDNTQELAFAKGFYSGAKWNEKQFEKVEGEPEGWFEQHDHEFMCGFRFDEPVELPCDVYIKRKEE